MLSAKIQKEAPGCASGGCEKGHARARARYVEERVQERDVGVRDARERVCGGRGGASSSGVCEWFEHVRQNKIPYCRQPSTGQRIATEIVLHHHLEETDCQSIENNPSRWSKAAEIHTIPLFGQKVRRGCACRAGGYTIG